MNKLNHLGNELMELKRELTQSHSNIVLKSLNQLAEQMLAQELIDHVTFGYLKDRSQSIEQFQTFCLTQSDYCLDQEALLKIYDQKRLELVDYLNRSVETYQLTSKSFLKEEEVVIVKSFIFDREMACDFFGIDEQFCENLYGRKRFIERFVVLRYKKILNEFIEKYPLTDVPFKIDRTPVFFDETQEAYAIEFLVKFKLEALENLEEKNFVNHFQTLMSDLIRYMNHSMGMNVPIKRGSDFKKNKSLKQPISSQEKPSVTTPTNKPKKEEALLTPLTPIAPITEESSSLTEVEEVSLSIENPSEPELTLIDDPTDLDKTFILEGLESDSLGGDLLEDIDSELELELELEDLVEGIGMDELNHLI